MVIAPKGSKKIKEALETVRDRGLISPKKHGIYTYTTLEKRGYIRFNDNDASGSENWYWEITPKGSELLEKIERNQIQVK